MKILHLSLGLALVAACGDDKAKPDAGGGSGIDAPGGGIDAKLIDAKMIDAPAYDFSCFGQANPTTATNPVTASGTTETLNGSFQITPVGSVNVSACPSSSLTCPANGPGKALATATSDATSGNFTLSNIATGGTPLDAYIKGAKTGQRTSYVYPPNPIVTSLSQIPVLMLSDTQLQTLGTVFGVTVNPADAVVIVAVLDCANNPIMGATVTIKQGANDAGMQFTAMGATIAVNVTPDTAAGGTTVAASYGGMTFPSHNVTSFANGDTATAIRPGP